MRRRLAGVRGALAVLLALCASAEAMAQAQAQAAPVGDAETLALGRRLFMAEAQPSCTVCHVLKDAGSTAEVGPPLDELKPDAARVARALRNGIGVMPSFREKLTDPQIDALARYVARATGAER